MDTQLADILAATARLEEQAVGLRRDVSEIKQHTETTLAIHAIKINSLERSRATFRGWAKGVSAVGIVSGVISFFKWGV